MRFVLWDPVLALGQGCNASMQDVTSVLWDLLGLASSNIRFVFWDSILVRPASWLELQRAHAGM